MVSDEARRLFAVVVNELWDKHPELVVPGWERREREWRLPVQTLDGLIWLRVEDAPRTDILAAAALCADHLQETGVFLMQSGVGEWLKCSVLAGRIDSVTPTGLGHTSDWPAAQFAAILAEKGIEHE